MNTPDTEGNIAGEELRQNKPVYKAENGKFYNSPTPDTEVGVEEAYKKILWAVERMIDSTYKSPEHKKEEILTYLKRTLTTYASQIREERDTYWKKRTRKQDIKNQQLKKGLRTAQKTISKLQTELDTRDTYWKERVEEAVKAERERILKACDVNSFLRDEDHEDFVVYLTDIETITKATPITNEDNLK